MKRLSLIFLMVLSACLAKGQFLQITEGPLFPAPKNGIAKILQMKNGSTFFLHIDFASGINAQVYEPVYRGKTETQFEPAKFKLRSGKVEGIFETNGDVVLMFSDTGNNETALYRLVVDGKSATLKNEEKIASVKKIALRNDNTESSADNLPELAVSKDATDGNYALAFFNNNLSDTSKRIEVILYGNDNREINRAFYSAKKEKYKYIKYIDMAVIGPDKVAALLYGYNRQASGEKTGEMILATLEKGASSLKISELNYSNDLVPENGIVRYEKIFNQLLVLTTARVKSDTNKLRNYLGYINLASRELNTNTVIGPGEKVKLKYTELNGKKAVYKAVPQNILLNEDRSYTIIFEEMETETKNGAVSHSIIRNTSIVNYNPEGEVTDAYFIPLEHHVTGIPVIPFYLSQQNILGQQLFNNAQYSLSKYITDGHNSFLLLNDKQVNAKGGSLNKIEPFKDMTGTDVFFCRLSGKEISPELQYVFGKSISDEERKLALFSVSDYDRANNLLVLLKQDKENGRSGVKLVWLQP